VFRVSCHQLRNGQVRYRALAQVSTSSELFPEVPKQHSPVLAGAVISRQKSAGIRDWRPRCWVTDRGALVAVEVRCGVGQDPLGAEAPGRVAGS
jgi:hypothetical protein